MTLALPSNQCLPILAAGPRARHRSGGPRRSVTVVGSLPIAFNDYGMTAPESMRVLSIEENGTMEFTLHFTQA